MVFSEINYFTFSNNFANFESKIQANISIKDPKIELSETKVGHENGPI